MALDKEWYTFKDLVRLGYVPNRTTLKRWQAKQRFPTGVRIGPNSVRWHREQLADLDRSLRTPSGDASADPREPQGRNAD